jgi:hypothetical protein
MLYDASYLPGDLFCALALALEFVHADAPRFQVPVRIWRVPPAIEQLVISAPSCCTAVVAVHVLYSTGESTRQIMELLKSKHRM